MLPRLCWPFPIFRVAIRSRSKPNMTVWLISKHPRKSTDLKGARERASSFRRRKEQKEGKKRPSRIKGKISLRIFRFGTRPLYLTYSNEYECIASHVTVWLKCFLLGSFYIDGIEMLIFGKFFVLEFVDF